ncbi:MAG: hypothetical protein NkDv07_0116 [Candidatus Improbicoccus devescovinae]|nr:MAG: hypothetical protein NkDv07_0116 [Candidatus Improbicoccus devescovinae]
MKVSAKIMSTVLLMLSLCSSMRTPRIMASTMPKTAETQREPRKINRTALSVGLRLGGAVFLGVTGVALYKYLNKPNDINSAKGPENTSGPNSLHNSGSSTATDTPPIGAASSGQETTPQNPSHQKQEKEPARDATSAGTGQPPAPTSPAAPGSSGSSSETPDMSGAPRQEGAATSSPSERNESKPMGYFLFDKEALEKASISFVKKDDANHRYPQFGASPDTPLNLSEYTKVPIFAYKGKERTEKERNRMICIGGIWLSRNADISYVAEAYNEQVYGTAYEDDGSMWALGSYDPETKQWQRSWTIPRKLEDLHKQLRYKYFLIVPRLAKSFESDHPTASAVVATGIDKGLTYSG